jgi:DNA repair exonuclease SbcCD ATPase subunit
MKVYELEKQSNNAERFKKELEEKIEIVNYQSQLLNGQDDFKNQALSERSRAKKLARKLEYLKTRIVDLKEDKVRLEAYVQNDRDLYSDLQESQVQYRVVKSMYDSLMVYLKTTLEKTIGDYDIEIIDPSTKEMRLDYERYIFILTQNLV